MTPRGNSRAGRDNAERVLVIGAGRHGLVVLDALRLMAEQDGALEPIGLLDDNPTLTGEQLLGLPVLGRPADLPAIPHERVVVAIGDNHARKRVFERLRNLGESFLTIQHPVSVLSAHCDIGRGCMIGAAVVVNAGATVGLDVILNSGCIVEHDCRIGGHSHVGPRAVLCGGVTVGEGSLLGAGSVVKPNIQIGAWSVIGAGAVVVEDIPEGVTAVGVPARVMPLPRGS